MIDSNEEYQAGELVEVKPEFERVERFQALQAGHYWRAINDVPHEGIEVDTTLLIESIRWVDNSPHTIVLRSHPLKYGHSAEVEFINAKGDKQRVYLSFKSHEFRLRDFLDNFEFEPDYQKLRTNELLKIQGKINDLQTELVQTPNDPVRMAEIVDAGLKEIERKAGKPKDESSAVALISHTDPVKIASGTIAEAIGSGITEQGVKELTGAINREKDVATVKAQWLQSKTSDLGKTIAAMTPFYAEQAAAALAQTSDIMDHMDKLLAGIKSLELYVGKDVEVHSIRKGESAPRNVPLSFIQKKLMMDEELAVWVDVDKSFDCTKRDLFYDALANHDDLVNQIFPTERCILVMAATRRFIDYGNSAANMVMAARNKEVFLLARDGMNINIIASPVESHLGAARLFPSQDEQDRVFNGLDGSSIKFDDVRYGTHLRAHEVFALHYKRFLLLVCGLDHRLKLFGDFYDGPPSLNFVTQKFQDDYCRFIHDDDGFGLLAGEKRQQVGDWINEMNSYARSGSRMLCNWRRLMNPETAPGACRNYPRGEGFDFRYQPANDKDVVIAYRAGQNLYVDIDVSGYSYKSGDRAFTCKVNLSKAKDGREDDLSRLCLDAVKPDDLRWYIHNRDSRSGHLTYIRFFKQALKYILAERETERDSRERLSLALHDGDIAHGAEATRLVDQAVIAWRAANRGKPVPVYGESAAAWKSLLDQMYMLAGEGERQVEEVEAFIVGLGYRPLRMVLSGGAKVVVYAEPTAEERDDRLTPHAWVHRITVERGKAQYAEKTRRWALLPASEASETTLHQWPEASEWAGRSSVFQSYTNKQAQLGKVAGLKDAIQAFGHDMTQAVFDEHFSLWSKTRDEMLKGAKSVENPCLIIPVGATLSAGSTEADYLCVGSERPHVVLYRAAPNEESRARVRAEFVSVYKNKKYALEFFEKELARKEIWQFFAVGKVGVDLATPYAPYELRCTNGSDDSRPLLAQWWTNIEAKYKSYKTKYWLAPEACNQAGELCLDDVLGIKLPEDYDPVVMFKFVPNDQENNSPWFDICPRGTEEKAYSKGVGVRGYIQHSAGFLTANAARESIVESLGLDRKAVLSTDLPDRGIAIPEEVLERWYVVPSQKVEA